MVPDWRVGVSGGMPGQDYFLLILWSALPATLRTSGSVAVLSNFPAREPALVGAARLTHRIAAMLPCAMPDEADDAEALPNNFPRKLSTLEFR